MTTISRNRTSTRFAAVALVGLLGAACAGYTAKLATITVSPNSPDASLVANSSQQFTAEGRDARGALFAITPTWTVEASGGTIDTNGLFTAGAMAGSYLNTVRATEGDVSGNASVIVTAARRTELASISVTPLGSDTVPATTTRQFRAEGLDSAGHAVPFTPTWAVVAGGGTITNTGLFTAGTVPGIYINTIKASLGTIAGYASLTVASTAASIATMEELVHFAYDKSDLSDSARATLDSKVKVFQSNPAMRILIVGHTDDRGTGSYNLELGTRRAEAVRDYLVAQGVATSRIDLETRGETQPMASGSSAGAMAQNRRDAFTILLVVDKK
jgi:outer membrane protein OmpA-like peptidoglycan-associated protein